jgi:hypothetical protein
MKTKLPTTAQKTLSSNLLHLLKASPAGTRIMNCLYQKELAPGWFNGRKGPPPEIDFVAVNEVILQGTWKNWRNFGEKCASELSRCIAEAIELCQQDCE